MNTRTCDDCGTTIPYEPLDMLGRDLGHLLKPCCEECASKREETAARKERDEREARLLETIRSLIPIELRSTDRNHPKFNKPLWDKVAEWQPGDLGQWLGIVGPAGRCKTRVMALKANLMIRAGYRVGWTSAVKIQESVSMRHSSDRAMAKNANEHLQECMVVSILVLDDLGKNVWTPAFESWFFTLLDHRRNHRLPVLWTSNVHPTELSQVISASNRGPIIGRLVDGTNVLKIRAEAQPSLPLE